MHNLLSRLDEPVIIFCKNSEEKESLKEYLESMFFSTLTSVAVKNETLHASDYLAIAFNNEQNKLFTGCVANDDMEKMEDYQIFELIDFKNKYITLH